MSGVNWKKLSEEVEGCKNFKEIEKLMMECKVDESDVFSKVKMSIRSYSGSRDYRDKRNIGIKNLREEVKKLKKELGRS